MSLVPWRNKGNKDELSTIDSYDLLDRFRTDMNRMFDRFFSERLPFGDMLERRTLEPTIDVSETDNEITVRAEVPGIDPKDIDVSLTGQTLVISGEKTESREKKDENFFHSERRFGSFRRTVTLPVGVNTEQVSAEHKNGLLTIKLKKRESAVAKRITVQTGK